MLLINGVIALIGIFFATLVVMIKMHLGLHGALLVLLCFFGLWAYLFLSSLAEDWLISKFNKETA